MTDILQRHPSERQIKIVCYTTSTQSIMLPQNKHIFFSLLSGQLCLSPVTQLLFLAETLLWIHCLSLSLFLLLSCSILSSPRSADSHSVSMPECLQAISLSLSLSLNIWSRLVVVLLDHQKLPQGAHLPQLQLDSCPVSISSSPLALKQGGKYISDLVKIDDGESGKLSQVVFAWLSKARGEVKFVFMRLPSFQKCRKDQIEHFHLSRTVT